MRSTRIMITIWNICTGMRTTTMGMNTAMGRSITMSMDTVMRRTTTMSMSTAMGRSITMSMSITTGRNTSITMEKDMNIHMNMCIPMFIGA